MAQNLANPTHPVPLWFGLLGGAVAWTVHLLAAYALAEFGCLTPAGHTTFLGLTPVIWGIVGVTLITAAAAAAATLVAYRAAQRLRGREGVDTEYTLARIGWTTSALFLFIILFETIPIFYFLREC